MVGMAVIHPHLWWLVFVALGMGTASAGILGQVHQLKKARLREGTGAREGAEDAPEEASEEEPEARREAPASRPVEDPRTARVDTLCDKLLAELRAGPGVLRDVVHQPEQTVEGLRKSCHELARRERELRELSSPEDERRLEEERSRVAARVESERDAVVKERLEGALKLLDEQRRQRAELATAASRLEAEHMRLYYTLENLYTQVLRVRSADAASVDVAGAGLRRSVEQLGQEMDAVAEALEDAHSDAPPPTRVPTR
jgi:chromosome segregation ATPase